MSLGPILHAFLMTLSIHQDIASLYQYLTLVELTVNNLSGQTNAASVSTANALHFFFGGGVAGPGS
jgi:hypothetical protein